MAEYTFIRNQICNKTDYFFKAESVFFIVFEKMVIDNYHLIQSIYKRGKVVAVVVGNGGVPDIIP